MKLKTYKIINFLLFMYLVYIFFYQLSDIFGGGILTYFILLFPTLFIILFALLKRNKTITKKYIKMFFCWIILILLILVHNASFKYGIYFDSIRFVLVTIFTMALVSFKKWDNKLLKYITVLSLVHVFSTIIFYFSNDLFKNLIMPLFEFPPVGSNNGLEGFHTGLTNHYSLNGTYCSVAVISLGSLIMMNSIKKEKNKVIYVISFLLSLISLLLIGKRAHLLFCLFPLFLLYYLFSPEKKSSKFFKISLAGFIVCFIIVILIESGSPLGLTFNRFLNISSQGDISNGRFEMWNLAWKEFLNHPILGLGWNGYRYSYANNLFVAGNYAGGEYLKGYMYLDTHNVYLQILCEFGIVGFCIFIYALLFPFFKTINLIKQMIMDNKSSNKIKLLSFSFCIQTFMILYSFTGCCINDITFLIYMLGLGIASTEILNMKEEKI